MHARLWGRNWIPYEAIHVTFHRYAALYSCRSLYGWLYAFFSQAIMVVGPVTPSQRTPHTLPALEQSQDEGMQNFSFSYNAHASLVIFSLKASFTQALNFGSSMNRGGTSYICSVKSIKFIPRNRMTHSENKTCTTSLQFSMSALCSLPQNDSLISSFQHKMATVSVAGWVPGWSSEPVAMYQFPEVALRAQRSGI